VRQEAFATWATVPALEVVPAQTPGGNPEIEEPGYVPQSPVMRVLPVLVTVEYAIAPYVPALPMRTGGARFPIVAKAEQPKPQAAMRMSRLHFMLIKVISKLEIMCSQKLIKAERKVN